MAKPVLYFSPGTRSSRVYWLLLELGIDVEIKPIRLDHGEHRTPEYTKLNPACEVPTFVDGNLTLTDSSAIILHILDHHDKDGKWGGKIGSAQRAQLYRWALYCASRADDAAILPLIHSKILPENMRDPKLVETKTKEWHERVAPVLLAGIGHNKYFGFHHEEFTADDVIVGYVIATASKAGLLDNEKSKPLVEYLGRIATRPNFAKAFQLPSK